MKSYKQAFPYQLVIICIAVVKHLFKNNSQYISINIFSNEKLPILLLILST